MNAFNFLSNPIAEALGWTLLHAIWQGFAVVLPIAILLYLLRNRSSSLRYRVGALTLLSQLVVSIVTFVWYYTPAASSLPLSTSALTGRPIPIRWQIVTQTLPWHLQTRQFLESHLSQFVLIYLIGVALFGLRLAGGWFYLQHLSRTAIQPAARSWAQLTNQLRSALAIRALVQVRESTRIVVPMVVGVLKPVLLLPIGLATSLTVREIEVILAHELAHVKRHDYAVNLLQSVVEVLYFFHPALWWLSARVREEREHCCDDLAVQVCGGDGHILAHALARVEELRLAQPAQTPVLAMALASNRQQLLHRVKRMLGVPTRPFVSNGSLAGLTLATILLMSVSVYAVQQQEKPKRKTTQPQATRRHKVNSNSEYGMVDNKKVSYIVWNGQKLPANRVARLQRQLDQVMAGQLSFDTIPQADRDILLTIVEKNHSFDEGMGALANGLAHINYNNIVASALTNVPLSPDGTVEGLAKVNYDSIISKAMATVDTNIVFKENGIVKSGNAEIVSRYNQRQLDSLNQLIAQRSQQVQALQLQMEKMRFPVEESERSQEVLEWRKNKLMDQRNALIEKHQQLLNNEGKQKLSLAEVEKQLTSLEPEIKKQEQGVEEVNKQIEEARSKLEEARKPLEKLERETEQLDKQMSLLSDEISRHEDSMEHLMSKEFNYEYNLRTVSPRRVGRTFTRRTPMPRTPTARFRGYMTPVTPVAPATAPRPVVAPSGIVGPSTTPAVPATAPRRAGRSVPVPTPPGRATTPRSTPKPALAPNAQKPE